MTNNHAITIALNTECHLVMKDWQQGKLAPQHQLDAIESMTDWLVDERERIKK